MGSTQTMISFFIQPAVTPTQKNTHVMERARSNAPTELPAIGFGFKKLGVFVPGEILKAIKKKVARTLVLIGNRLLIYTEKIPASTWNWSALALSGCRIFLSMSAGLKVLKAANVQSVGIPTMTINSIWTTNIAVTLGGLH